MTVLGAVMVVLGLVLSFVVLEVGGLIAQRAQVSAAADAAALAAAAELALGHGSQAAIAAAVDMAAANGAELLSCDCSGTVAVVQVAKRSSLRGVPILRARARAIVDLAAT